MNGAGSLIGTLVAGGVDTCFTNPGTSEMHIVAALDKCTGMRCVLGLFEGVATGAADGYARMAGKPACTLLHLGPGLANGLANLHNASRARVPIINIVGQHPSYHLPHDAPLTSDIEGIARPYSKWLRTSLSPAGIGKDAADAIIAAGREPGQIATMIIPVDVAWGEEGTIATLPGLTKPQVPSEAVIKGTAILLRSGVRTCMILAGSALHGKGLATAGRISAATGAKLLAPYPFARLERGAGTAVIDRIPYVPEQAAALLKEFTQVILVGAAAPVAYFASQGKSSVLTSPESVMRTLASPEEDAGGALEALAAEMSLHGAQSVVEKAERPTLPTGNITLQGLADVVGALLPEGVIVVDESMTSGRGMMTATRGAPPHDWLANTGGSIGIAMPLAVGAAVGARDRRVLCLTADGSGMYTAQALWTMARESLKVTTVVFANRDYAVLKREFSNIGVGEPGRRALDLFEIGHPNLDWVMLGKSMGVPGVSVKSLEEFAKALREGLGSDGPKLIEVKL